MGGGPSAAAALNLVGGSALAGGSSVAAVAKALTSALASGRLGAGLSADSETVRTLVMLLSPGSPLLLCSSAAVVALQSVTSRPNFAPETVLAFDAGERAGVGEGAAPAGQDVLRAIVQVSALPPARTLFLRERANRALTPRSPTSPPSFSQALAGLAQGHAHVHTLHGTAEGGPTEGRSAKGGGGWGNPLTLPLPEGVRHRAAACLHTLLLSFRADGDGGNVPADADQLSVLRKSLQAKRVLQMCARTFNAKPKRGVEALRVTALLGVGTKDAAGPAFHTAVAELLHTHGASAGFDPVAIGEYLGTGETQDDDIKRRAHVRTEHEHQAILCVRTRHNNPPPPAPTLHPPRR